MIVKNKVVNLKVNCERNGKNIYSQLMIDYTITKDANICFKNNFISFIGGENANKFQLN